jgi:ubiquitin C-terminal hydrolase
MVLLISQPIVVSTFASPHKPTLKPKACKRASTSLAHVTAFQVGFRIAHAQKNKINLCFVDRLVQIDNDKKIKLNK